MPPRNSDSAPGTPTNPWDMRPGETARAYAAFCAYRDMGPDRSLRGLRDSGNRAASNLRQMADWSSKHDWPDRAASWDQFVDHEVQDDQLEQIKEMRRRHAALASNMLNQAAQRILSFDAADLSPTELARWVEIGVKIERMSRGEAAVTVAQADHQDPGDQLDGGSVLALLAQHPEAADLAHHLHEAGAIVNEQEHQ